MVRGWSHHLLLLVQEFKSEFRSHFRYEALRNCTLQFLKPVEAVHHTMWCMVLSIARTVSRLFGEACQCFRREVDKTCKAGVLSRRRVAGECDVQALNSCVHKTCDVKGGSSCCSPHDVE